MNDLFGKALLDFQQGRYSEDIRTETNISEEEILPIPYLFRDYSEMPILEQRALDLSYGKVFDVGCGAGNHSLYLIGKGLKVLALDTSVGAIEVCHLRGIENALCEDILNYDDEKFDTILLLMNGTGIFGKVKRVVKYLKHLRSLLNPEGQILIDSTDLRYLYPEGIEKGSILVPAGMNYYGEIEYSIYYKKWSGKPFSILYLDEVLFKRLSEAAGLEFEVVERGDQFNYLVRLTIAENNRF